MARSPFQSDFVVEREPPTLDEVEATPPSARTVKWVYIATALMIAALIIICMVGPHIPSGE